MNNTINLVCFSYDNSGAYSNRIVAMAKALAQSGVKTNLYFLLPNYLYDTLNIDKEENLNIIYLWGKDDRRDSRTLMSSILKLRKLIRKDDIVYCGTHFSKLLFPLTYFLPGKKVYESTEHPFLNPQISLSRKIFVKIANYLTRNDIHFVISESLGEFLKKEGCDEKKISVMNMFVDSDRFRNVEKQAGTKRFISYCGSVSYGKDGVNNLIEAFAKISGKFPDVALRIIGPDIAVEDKPTEKLKELAGTLGVEDKVEFTGRIPSQQMPQYLKDSTILALARPDNVQAQNGFPTKLGEYLCTGNPVVVTSVGEIPKFIKHKVNGFLAEPGNIDSFAEQLEWVLEHPEEAAEIGQNGKKLTEYEFSAKEQVRQAWDFICNNI